jgi:Outer membrane protein beta-barrel domain
MEHLENDMDDLFQKAGELYPLKITESDWEAVAGKIQDENFGDLNVISGLTSTGTGNKRKWRLLLLLIPLCLAGIVFTSKIIHQHTSAAVHTVKHIPDSDKSESGNNIKANQLTEKKMANPSDHSTGGYSSIKKGMNPNSKTPIPAYRIRMAENNIHSGATMRQNKNDAHPSLGNTGPDKTKLSDSNIPISPAAPVLSASAQKTAVIPMTATVSGKKETLPETHDSATIETSKTTGPDSSLSKKKTTAVSKTSRGLYAGLLAGPDLSMVKFQSVKQLGYSLGVLVGYRFNQRLAIETGLMWDKKYYYTNGEYFKIDNAPPLSSSVTVNGNCSMLEIPLALRYDFASGKNHGFFIKAGLSSYLMKNQYYTTKRNGMPYGSWPVDSTMNYIFSIVQLSGGYEYSIGEKTKIRVEPYMNIPLKGLGEGNLPISSVGIYFGITYSFR